MAAGTCLTALKTFPKEQQFFMRKLSWNTYHKLYWILGVK